MWTNEDSAKMDMAADAARQELEKHLATLSPEAKKEVEWLRAWWKKNFMVAGHKRLGRIMVGK